MTGDSPLDMGPTEFKLLHFFMTHPERVYSREQLLNHVWGTNVYVEDRTVDVHIRRLRKALEHSGHDRMVQTVRGTGYRFRPAFMPFPPVDHRFLAEKASILEEYDACWNGCHGKGWCWSWCSVASPRLSLALFGYLPWFLLAAVTDCLSGISGIYYVSHGGFGSTEV